MDAILSKILTLLTVEATVFFIAALPVIELRGAIPVGISLGMSPLHATVVGFLGSMLPVPFLLFTIRPVFNLLKKTKLCSNIIDKLIHRSTKNNHKVQKYGAWGLVLIVAIPLPGTGVWSGTLAAALLDIRFKWAFPAIMLGNLLAAIAVILLSQGVINVW